MPQLQGVLLFTCITILTCNCFLLIGYDNGVLGGVVGQPAFNATFNKPNATMLGLIVSLYEVGCFLGAIATAFVGESLGRRKSIFLGAIVMIVGAVLQASSFSRAQMIIARIVSGIGMGFINSTAPVYQSEFSPKATRGLYACAQLSTLNLGIFMSYWIDYGFAGQIASSAWRVPVILQCIFIVPIAILSFVLPETPRWLIAHGRDAEAQEVYSRLHGASEGSAHTFEKIRAAVIIEDQAQHKGLKGLLREDDIGSRRRLLIACGIQFFQQLGGINGIIYYSGTIFSVSLGFSDHLASLMSGFLFTWFFVASFIPWLLIDRLGRRPLLLGSIAVMAAVFVCMAGMVSQIQYATAIAHTCGVVATALLFIYLGAFTIGFQATVWVYPPEILPLRLRQVGTSIATACNWIINFMVVQVTPVGVTSIGWKYYIIYAVFNACFLPIIYLFFPETKGMELEDVDKLFARGEAAQAIAIEDNKNVPTTHLEHGMAEKGWSASSKSVD